LQYVLGTGRVIEAACWARARRKFHDLHVALPTLLITEALRRICELYGIEESIRGDPPDERLLHVSSKRNHC
jgi:hypothetical protein